jgi:hypothetical protein
MLVIHQLFIYTQAVHIVIHIFCKCALYTLQEDFMHIILHHAWSAPCCVRALQLVGYLARFGCECTQLRRKRYGHEATTGFTHQS